MAMQSRMVALLAIALAIGVVGCSKQHESAGDALELPLANLSKPPGKNGMAAMLAYEHTVEILLAEDKIAARTAEVQQACNGGKFGACVVLGVETQGGEFPSAELKLRAVPAAIEPLIKAAGTEGEVGSRRTTAEDLAVVVADNNMLQQRLRKEHERLSEFQQRRDLRVADMISLSKQLAETEATLEVAEREAAQHRRRIDTQLLTIRLHPPGGQTGRSEIGQAFRDFGGIFTSAIAWMIRAAAVLLPLAMVLLAAVLVIRRVRRSRKES
ncbi:DUF4349 domain-containing protein [Lysobacter sp. CFH 32150]|uniref:DUF4349 domain-containing protein n=1 Tax=Lysobacter sp. CFH 32150 TaxID=2927128 RepID=UPI001FA780F4|nr:DUF4349 domain-containing protein [Lysobacter sp. CFH 32150]MCI4569360.1 DUF4349 domain-containing protein [Lysobacter sp. CFH 32150]